MVSTARVILLDGPAGVGKSVAAEKAALMVADPVDVFVFKDVLSVEAARHLIDVASIRPFGSGSKVLIVDMDRHTPEAPNAMLKLLEEPPNNVIIILVSSVALPETIVSRCKRVRFLSLSQEEVTEVLMLRGMSRPVAERYCHVGSPGEALRLYAKEQSNAAVQSFIKAVEDRDWELVFRVISKWQDVDNEILETELKQILVGGGYNRKLVAALEILATGGNQRLTAIVVASTLMKK
jgi:hypothetical protein